MIHIKYGKYWLTGTPKNVNAIPDTYINKVTHTIVIMILESVPISYIYHKRRLIVAFYYNNIAHLL